MGYHCVDHYAPNHVMSIYARLFSLELHALVTAASRVLLLLYICSMSVTSQEVFAERMAARAAGQN